MKVRSAALIAFLLLATACRSRSCGKKPSAAEQALAEAGLEVLTAEQANDRVSRVFPHGVASENARAEVGEAPAPPGVVGPETDSSFVATIVLRSDATTPAKIAAALGPAKEAKGARYVKVHDAASGEWVFASQAPKATRFDLLAVVVDLVDDDAKPRRAHTAAELDEHAAFAKRLAVSLGEGAPSFSATPEQAAKRAAAGASALAEVGDSDAMDVAIVVAPAKPGERFAGRASWDAVYSAGFVWGDGDYFHWVPSPKTDVSQGIDVSSRTGTGYFFPETLEKSEAESSLDDLRFTFNVARTWQPALVFDVMARAATYVARRLHGVVVDAEQKPLDTAAARARVVTLEAGLKTHGLTPGAGLALRLY